MGPDLVEPVFLMPYSDADPFSDYRCVVNGSATQVIFERTQYDNGKVGPTRLYVLDLVSQSPVAPSKLNDVSPALRPDWCWYTGQITFMNPEAVYIQDTGVAPVRPLDPQANVRGTFRPEFQGRAPWFSPDGKWVAFESTRADPKGELYAIFIQSARGDGPARQVTDTKWNANHAKFYPDGQRLVATLLQKPGGKRRGLVMLDVSAFVSLGGG